MLATYHNHSTYSDGKKSIAEVVAAAEKMGIDELGISDHLTLPPAGDPPRWSMKAADLPAYVEEIAAFSFNDAMQVRLGIELDWFDSHEEELRRVTRAWPFDYIIGSVHFVGGFPVDGNPHRWKNLSQQQIDDIHTGYWQRMKRMAESEIFSIAAHLDLPKKFNHRPREQPWDLIHEALDALARANVVVELNTAGWRKKCAEPYPNLELLKECKQRGIAVTLSADAHHPKDLLRDFGKGAALLRATGYTEIARFANRNITFDPIDFEVTGEPIPPRGVAEVEIEIDVVNGDTVKEV